MASHSKGFLDAVFEIALRSLWSKKSSSSGRPISRGPSQPFRFAAQADENVPATTVEVWQPSPEWQPPVVRETTPDMPLKDSLADLRDKAVRIAHEALSRRKRGELIDDTERDYVQSVIRDLMKNHREVPLVLRAMAEA